MPVVNRIRLVQGRFLGLRHGGKLYIAKRCSDARDLDQSDGCSETAMQIG